MTCLSTSCCQAAASGCSHTAWLHTLAPASSTSGLPGATTHSHRPKRSHERAGRAGLLLREALAAQRAVSAVCATHAAVRDARPVRAARPSRRQTARVWAAATQGQLRTMLLAPAPAIPWTLL